MALKERINPKTGKKEYKARYYFIRDGKKRDSETGWFSTPLKAEKEAEKLKEEKEKEERHKVVARRDKKVIALLEDYIQYLKEESDRVQTNYSKSRVKAITTIYKFHTPIDIADIKIKDVSGYTFKRWLSYINEKDIAGTTVRYYRKYLLQFNHWLAISGYYLEEGLEEQIEYAINNCKIKANNIGNREEDGKRAVVSLLDFMKITYYYYDEGIDKFVNFYYYTLFYVLFFGGMRVEELIGLQWKFIDLRENKRIISIKNAIASIEDEEHALERVKKGKYLTKNKTSIRNIPIFDFYYDLLLDYKESYRYEMGLTKEEMEECFVFPRLFYNRFIPDKYASADRILREFYKVQKAKGINKTDLQMLRHSCATFLILPPPEGLGFTEEKVKDYFGHTDVTMLTKIYAKLNVIQKTDRMKDTFSDIFSPDTDTDREKEQRAKEELIQRIKGDNQKKQIARKKRIFAQIDRCIANGKKEYFFTPRDKEIIEEYMRKPEYATAETENRIAFVEEV